ncbi:hypothetical protein CJ030_MR5G011868 [Morella rubra]|uniref:Uncharacterized protein n=1 Tax=Morella rubra TaxID=262757 RepID=A0A6A1VLS5_9ROSI|nr:hypothetical protein CJ030_MR5G011868 [Morella rubra]
MGIESQDEDMTKVWGSEREDVAAEDEEEGEDIGVGDGDWERGIYRSIENGEDGLQVKTLNPRHRCGTHYINGAVTVKWIAKQYLEKIKDIPQLTTTALIEEIWRDCMVGNFKFKVYRVLKLALEMVNGKHVEKSRPPTTLT